MPLDSVATASATPALAERYAETRAHTAAIVAPLSPEDQVVQAMHDASPAKWHLAHTTWFFEELVLKQHLEDYRGFDERFAYCFNSYYESLGARHPRIRRGVLTRPTSDEVAAYRAHVDEAMHRFFERGLSREAAALVEIGIHHEQQHQELMLTDILVLFAANPLRPAYMTGIWDGDGDAASVASRQRLEAQWQDYSGGIFSIGHYGEGFAYDNEGPRHDVLLRDFKLATHPVTNREWLDFIGDGGYSNPAHWLADGWTTVQREGWAAPGYWEERDGQWQQMTLYGMQPVDPDRPVSHVSLFEADAFARWADARLPNEFEWEVAARAQPFSTATFSFDLLIPPRTVSCNPDLMFGGVWQWTQSAYLPYPGYRPMPGPLGEYNGKFMSGQMVLRGSSCVTPPRHTRPTYRNFFYPHQRWQMTGLRLARDI